MKYSIYIALIINLLLIPLWSSGQTIDYGCNQQSNSEERIQQVQLQALDPARTITTDQLNFDVPSNSNCYVYEDEELEIYNQINYNVNIDNSTNKQLYFLILIDWNGDGEYQIQGDGNEVVASGETTQGAISGMITPPNNLIMPNFRGRMRIIIADDPDKLFDPSMSTTVELMLRGSDPKVTISKDGNNLIPNPSDICMPFNNYEQLVFRLENISSPNLNLNVEIENIVLTDMTTNQDYTVNIINDDELIVLDKLTPSGSECGTGITCNIPYGVGQIFNMDNTDTIVLALAWEALRTRLPDLRDFPIKPNLYKATITAKIISHTSTTECLYIGCCKETDVELTTETDISQLPTWLPLYIGSEQEIQILTTGSGLIEVFDDYQSSIRSKTFIRLGSGFHAQKGSFVHAYIDDCPTIPDDGNTKLLSNNDKPHLTLSTENQSLIPTPSLVNIFPNPSTNHTTLEYLVEKSSLVEIILFNSQGQQIEVVLAQAKQVAGSYQITLDIEQLNKGIYFYKLQIGQQQEVLRLIKK